MATKGRTKGGPKGGPKHQPQTNCKLMLRTKDESGKFITRSHPKFQACVDGNEARMKHMREQKAAKKPIVK